MFRKDPQIKALANLKSSERRRMLTQILASYNLPSNLAKESEEKILPSTIKQTTFRTVKDVMGTIYTDDQHIPVWFKTKDSEDLIPTIYTVWKAPWLLPIVHTHPHVIEVLENGADLMLPGSVPPFDARINQGSIVGVADTKDVHLIKAVGFSNYRLSEFERTIGTTGVAVSVLHTFDDMLFKLGEKTGKKIRAPESLDMEMKLKEEEVQQVDASDEAEPATAALDDLSIEDKEGKLDQTEEPEQADSDDEVQLTTEDIDHIFRRALYQTLVQPSSPLKLPLPASEFMNHINDNLPDANHPSIQMKKTSWKKAAKYLKVMEKDGFLKLKGKGDVITVVSAVTKESNDTLKNFVPYKIKKKAAASTSGTTAKDDKKANKGLILEKWYKATSPIRQVFNDVDMSYVDYYSPAQVKEILNKYIAKNELINEKNKKTIILDDLLYSLLNKNNKPDSRVLGRDQVLEPFLSKFSEFYRLIDPKETSNESVPIIRGSVPTVQIITETKIGRKLITRTSNFEPFGINATLFANELKVKCSGSTTVGPNVQNPKLTEVTVQGPHGKIVMDLLTKKYGLNVNWIKFEDKSKGKKKKPATPSSTA
ncbi:hypothetical protein WICPIJ_000636 [Wickerhamomyces pijperi]|uniref:SUI1 domain-containing protein n=1 Tax=Wickerhamomyces pijperi TaxID=599730 RepID=A0A9P8QG43_WICPI|nr:hypothetical protein WICPIJ_000636 [Wickerhamomyces pijperi]